MFTAFGPHSATFLTSSCWRQRTNERWPGFSQSCTSTRGGIEIGVSQYLHSPEAPRLSPRRPPPPLLQTSSHRTRWVLPHWRHKEIGLLLHRAPTVQLLHPCSAAPALPLALAAGSRPSRALLREQGISRAACMLAGHPATSFTVRPHAALPGHAAPDLPVPPFARVCVPATRQVSECLQTFGSGSHLGYWSISLLELGFASVRPAGRDPMPNCSPLLHKFLTSRTRWQGSSECSDIQLESCA